ncbi:hypothetical protein T492DRAFT_849455 [Pavlovales sp. CCMP2436]|nr:hypothetical protein T492DRAFT_849455 [Pavlovales sp. CCMP2436]|mmetsp:Transcript_5725/g.14946  ORF Transcript_5725/g.14946 Transcript_5725/m.14946 type:complete len:264 (-) Transcript_5725:320-1111(-)
MVLSTLIIGILAAHDERSIVDRMGSARSTVPLLSNPGRSISSDASGKLSWSAFKGAWRQEVGDVTTGVSLNQAKHADFFDSASIAKRVVDTDLKLDAQVTHDFSDKETKLAASLLTKNGVRVSTDLSKDLKIGKIDISKDFTDVPLSRQLGDRLTISPSIDVNEREVTLEVQQDIGSKNVFSPSATIGSDGAVQKWGLGWMSKLDNGDAVAAQIDPESAKLDLRYDKSCDDGSQWRINCNVPSLTADNALSNAAWSITRAWNK